jgi:pimeloyl-ACP methyl ester carboxylesterase
MRQAVALFVLALAGCATSVPTMYVWSTGDEFIGPVAARAAERFVTAPYRFEVLDGVSHWISGGGAGAAGGADRRVVGGVVGAAGRESCAGGA